MTKKIIVALLAASSFIYADDIANESAGSFQSKTWDVGVITTMVSEGSDGDILQNEVFGAGLHVGYRYSENWSAILEVSSISDDIETGSLKDSVRVVDYVAGATYDFSPESTFFTPYASLALGYRTVSDIDDRDDWNAIPGLGLKYLATDSLQIFLEAKARFSLERSEKGLMGTLGISYRFN